MESEFGLSQEMLDPESFTEDFAVYNSDLGVFEVYESQPLDTEDTFLLEDAKDLGNDLVEVTVARKSKDKVVSRNIYTFQVSTDSVAENAYLSNYTITGQFVSCRPASA